jgi:hypothetical protein
LIRPFTLASSAVWLTQLSPGNGRGIIT